MAWSSTAGFHTAARVGAAAHETAYDPEYAFEFVLRRVPDGVGVLIDSRA